MKKKNIFQWEIQPDNVCPFPPKALFFFFQKKKKKKKLNRMKVREKYKSPSRLLREKHDVRVVTAAAIWEKMAVKSKSA